MSHEIVRMMGGESFTFSSWEMSQRDPFLKRCPHSKRRGTRSKSRYAARRRAGAFGSSKQR